MMARISASLAWLRIAAPRKNNDAPAHRCCANAMRGIDYRRLSRQAGEQYRARQRVLVPRACGGDTIFLQRP